MLARRALLVAPRGAPLRAANRALIASPSLARCYATPAADSRPPVAVYGVDGTYASALYSASVKASTLDPVSRSLAALADVLKRDDKLPTILAAPTLTPDDKAKIVAELERHMGSLDKQGTMKNFLKTLAENNRLGMLGGICEKFNTLISAAKGEIDLVVTSAQKLDQKTLQRLETAVAKSEYSQGKRLKVVPKVNSDIKGGLVVEIGERTIDLSVQAKIAKMNKLLTDSI